jgi:hypothetical protein
LHRIPNHIMMLQGHLQLCIARLYMGKKSRCLLYWSYWVFLSSVGSSIVKSLMMLIFRVKNRRTRAWALYYTKHSYKVTINITTRWKLRILISWTDLDEQFFLDSYFTWFKFNPGYIVNNILGMETNKK